MGAVLVVWLKFGDNGAGGAAVAVGTVGCGGGDDAES